jgi:hypothetical protein
MDLNNRTVGTIHIRMSHIHIHIYTHVWLWVKFPYFDGMNIYITNIISHFSPFPIESEQDKRSTGPSEDTIHSEARSIWPWT